jgi:uncharacterized membrane protein YbhN (UPF0104 family)
MTVRRSAAVRVGVAVAGTSLAAVWLSRQVDSMALRQALHNVHWPWLVVAAAIVPIQTLLAAERWRRVSEALDLPLSRDEAWSEFALAVATNQVLPGGVAGDVVRVWRQRAHGLARATRSAVADRWWGQTTLFVLLMVGLVAWPKSAAMPTGWTAGLWTAAVVVVSAWGLPATLPVVGPVSADLRQTARRAPFPCLVLSGVFQMAVLAQFALCGLALGHLPGPWLWTAVPVALVATSLPISAGGWGVRELSAVAILPSLGWTVPEAMAVSLLTGFTFFLGAVPGFWVLVRRPALEARST